MDEYLQLKEEEDKIWGAIIHYERQLMFLPKCDYSYETEQELRERYNQNLKELYEKLRDIKKQIEALYVY